MDENKNRLSGAIDGTLMSRADAGNFTLEAMLQLHDLKLKSVSSVSIPVEGRLRLIVRVTDPEELKLVPSRMAKGNKHIDVEPLIGSPVTRIK